MTPISHNQQHACMLVELDSILDTRLGTIAKIGREHYARVLSTGYHSRNSEHFDGIDSELFKQMYRERDAVTLSLSLSTYIPAQIKDFVTRVNIVSASAPVKRTPSIHVNVYPYNPPQNVNAMIKKALMAHIQDKCEIEFVRYSPKDLHYDLIKHTYDHMVMYDLGEWLSSQIEDWQRRNRGLPDVTVFTPALCRAERIEDVPADISAMAEEVSRSLSTILNVFQLPIQFFCSILDPKMLGVSPPEAEAPGGDSGGSTTNQSDQNG